MPEDQLREIDKHILGTVWTSDEAIKNLTYLCDDLGHRFAGSDREHTAGEFLKRKMEEYGLQNVRVEEFPMASWTRGECKLWLTSPLERGFSAIAMPYCPSAEIEADVIDVGEGELPDFERLADQNPRQDRADRRRDEQSGTAQEPPQRQICLGHRARRAGLRLHQPEPRHAAHHRQHHRSSPRRVFGGGAGSGHSGYRDQLRRRHDDPPSCVARTAQDEDFDQERDVRLVILQRRRRGGRNRAPGRDHPARRPLRRP